MDARARRRLVVIADDYGIGSDTSEGILELARRGVVTGSVLLVNSPFAPAAVDSWQRSGEPMELGWHPNLTLDAPISSPVLVPSLVDRQGRFWRLGPFMKKLFFGRIQPQHIAIELKAQLGRFRALVGRYPRLVNSHQHISIFEQVGLILLDLLAPLQPRPYVRCVREPWGLIARIKGARLKRGFLNLCGRSISRRQEELGFPGNDWLGGITDPPWVKRDGFFEEWLSVIPGQTVEMSCHPGYRDETLLGRDCDAKGGMIERRVSELNLLRRPEFIQAAERAGLLLVAPSRLCESGVAIAA